MKKILSLLLCIVLLCLSLAGCAEDPIGEDLKNRDDAAGRGDEITELNFYIIVGEGTSEEAKKTIPQNINTYLKESYNIKLNINYFTADEYAANVLAAATAEGTARADIVLINSKELYDELHSKGLLLNLNDYYNSKKYRSLNNVIEDKLLAASLVKEVTPGYQETDGKYSYNYYTVPNNHLIDQYEYIIINKEMARDTLHFSNAKIDSMTTEASLAELLEAIDNYFGEAEYDINDYVKVVNGKYADKILLEYGVDSASEITVDSMKVNFVNISSYPTATEEEAFSSAYAIIKNAEDQGELTEDQQADLDKHYAKCMDIIFGLNTDAQLKNLLQYGYVGTNYKFVKNHKNENTNYIELLKGAEVVYNMNPSYTGNLYLSYYCNEIGWNETIHSDILKQNADALTCSEKTQAEVDAVKFEVTEFDTDCVVDLPIPGVLEGDVVFTWTSSSESVVVDGSKLIITVPKGEGAKTESVTITLVATYGCSSVTTTIKLKLKPLA